MENMNEISDELPLCPERSPDLLGPLYVKQTGIPDLKPETEAFLQSWIILVLLFGCLLEILKQI